MMRGFLRFSPLALLVGACAKEAPPTPPSLEQTGRVVDSANILDADFETELTNRLARLEDETKVQLVVATTTDLERTPIADYSVKLARDWGIGSKSRNDGLLVLVAPNERQVRIEVGYGLEASVKDEEAARIINKAMVPQFEHSDYEAGISDGVDRLIDEVTPHTMKEAA